MFTTCEQAASVFPPPSGDMAGVFDELAALKSDIRSRRLRAQQKWEASGGPGSEEDTSNRETLGRFTAKVNETTG